MERLLWISSSLVMAALLLWLALRALRELFGLKLALPFGPDKIYAPLSPAHWPCWLVFFVSLMLLWLGALLSYGIETGGFVGFRPRYIERFAGQGDAPRYIFMAENGYVSSGEYVNNIVFYPLYPLLVRLFSLLTGDNTALAGMIFSQLCYGFASVVFQKLAVKECEHAGYALFVFWLYPFGFFALGVFTEGLFLFLSLSALWFLRERRWLLAGAAAFLCTLTRTQGILLLLPAIYEVWCTWRKQGFCRRFFAVLSPLPAYGVYLMLNKFYCGDFFAYQYYESIAPWWQTPQWLGQTLAQQFSMGVGNAGVANWIYWPQLFLYFIAAAILFVGFSKKLPTSYLLYGTAYLGMCYTASWLISGGRYLLGCIPLFLCLGKIRNDWLRLGILAVELIFFVQFGIWFIQGQCIM